MWTVCISYVQVYVCVALGRFWCESHVSSHVFDDVKVCMWLFCKGVSSSRYKRKRLKNEPFHHILDLTFMSHLPSVTLFQQNTIDDILR